MTKLSESMSGLPALSCEALFWRRAGGRAWVTVWPAPRGGDKTVAMTDIVERIMRLWLAPPQDDNAAVQAFRQLYTDPVLINGAPMAAADLLTRARLLHSAFDGLHHELLHRVDAPGQVVIAFLMRGTHSGAYRTPLGEVAPTGKSVAIRTIDVLTLVEGRVSEVWVVADEFGLLTGLGAIQLTAAADAG